MLGYLCFTSRYLPRAISTLVIAAGIGYSVDSLGRLLVPDYSAVATAVLLTSAAVGELAFTLWLIVRGVRILRTGRLQQRDQSQRVIAAV